MIRLTGIKTADFEPARRLYVSAFPPEERRPWDDIVARDADRSSPLTLLGIYSDGVFAGIITVWHFATMRYVEHFAVAQAARGRGIGAQAITTLIAADSAPVVLEVEPESQGETASRRIRFYCRRGFIPHPGFRYVQPPYGVGLPPVELMLMSTAPIDLEATARTLHREVYGIG